MLRVSSGSISLGSASRNLSAALSVAAALTVCGCGSGVKFATGGGGAPVVSAVQNGPQLGYAWYAEDESLRPILGVPGSSQFGESVIPAGAYVTASASSPAGIALLIGTDQQVYMMSLPSGTPAQIGAQAATGSVIRFSPSGTTALIFVPGSNSATVVTGLASTTSAHPLASSSSILDAAVSDKGTVAGVLQSLKGATVSLLSGAGGRQVATLEGDGGVSFAGSSEDLVVADSKADTLTLVRTVSTTPLPVQIPTSNLLKSPVAVGTSLSGKFAAIANSGDSSVIRVDLSGASAAQRVICPAPPTLVAQLSGNGVFRFTDVGSGPVWVSDVTVASPSMLFIPALTTAGENAQTGATGAH